MFMGYLSKQQPVLCALCLAMGDTARKLQASAVTVANGFAVCEAHLRTQAAGFVTAAGRDGLEVR